MLKSHLKYFSLMPASEVFLGMTQSFSRARCFSLLWKADWLTQVSLTRFREA